MGQAIERLLQLSSGPLIASRSDPSLARELPSELMGLLDLRNGFYAFLSSLLVRPVDSDSLPLGVVQWNRLDLWKADYGEDLSQVIFSQKISLVDNLHLALTESSHSILRLAP
jgi:hypothetical protein